MTTKRAVIVAAIVAGVGATVYYLGSLRTSSLVLTGIVTTNDVIVSPLVGGRIDRLLVADGDTVVPGQLLAVIAPDELRADTSYYAHSAKGISSQVVEAEAALRYQKQSDGRSDPPGRSDACRRGGAGGRGRGRSRERAAHARAQPRAGRLWHCHDAGPRSSRAAYESASAHVAALKKQVDAQRAALALARSNAEQIAVKREPAPRRPTAIRGRRGAAREGRRAARLHRGSRPDRRHRRRAGRSRGRGGQRRPADPHPDQPGRPVGARRRGGDLHRPHPARRPPDGAAAVRRSSGRARCSTGASMPRSRRSAT